MHVDARRREAEFRSPSRAPCSARSATTRARGGVPRADSPARRPACRAGRWPRASPACRIRLMLRNAHRALVPVLCVGLVVLLRGPRRRSARREPGPRDARSPRGACPRRPSARATRPRRHRPPPLLRRARREDRRRQHLDDHPRAHGRRDPDVRSAQSLHGAAERRRAGGRVRPRGAIVAVVRPIGPGDRPRGRPARVPHHRGPLRSAPGRIAAHGLQSRGAGLSRKRCASRFPPASSRSALSASAWSSRPAAAEAPSKRRQRPIAIVSNLRIEYAPVR